MYLTVHASAGLVIGSQTGNPWLAFVLGVISHFALDAIPHDPIELEKYFKKEKGENKFILIAAIDMAVLIIIGLSMWAGGTLKFNNSIILAVFGAILPDLIWGVSDILKIKNKITRGYFEFHEWFHRLIYKPVYIPGKYAYLMQIILAVFFLWLYFKL